jgi:NAD(P)-dependent dehydrogenase (short-subunit alcohol dehydrogenase family)
MPRPGPDEVPDYHALARLDGRTVVVLGAGQGIGRQTAHALAQAGAVVGCVGRDRDRTEAVAREVGGFALIGDVLQRADMQRMFAQAVERMGAVHDVVDIVGMARPKPIRDFTDEDWNWQFDIVLRHAFLAVQIGGKAIADAGGGSITLVGSVSGVVLQENLGVYGPAKAAMNHFAAYAAVELGPDNVRVNVVVPGVTRTPRVGAMMNEDQWAGIGRMSPLDSIGLPSDVAGTILYLASPLARHVTGQSIVVDGGASLMPATLGGNGGGARR